MVRYGCAKTDSGGVECFVEFSEATTLLDSISSRCCRSFRIQIAKQRDESEGKKEKKNTRLSYIETEKKRKKETRCRTVREFQVRGKRKKKRRKENARIESLSFRPLVSFSFFFFFFFRPILNRVPKHPARTFRSTRFHY